MALRLTTSCCSVAFLHLLASLPVSRALTKRSHAGSHQMPDPLPWVDYSFSCPILTKVVDCPPVCVVDASHCPSLALCAPGLQLCLDGSCANVSAGAECSGDLASSPCFANECGYAVSCVYPLFRERLATCNSLLGEFYNASACESSVEQPADCPDCLVSAGSAPFVLVYFWLFVVAVLSLAWCAYNQRLRPVGKSALLLEIENMDPELDARDHSHHLHEHEAASDVPKSPSQERGVEMFNKLEQEGGPDFRRTKKGGYGSIESEANDQLLWTQTGYKTSYLGSVLYLCVMATMLGFQVLLLLLCLDYYAIIDGILGGKLFFSDESQSLFVFQCVWTLLAVWWLLLKWPSSIYSLFLRRCPLSKAQYVAVFTQEAEGHILSKDNEARVLVWSKALVKEMHAWIDWFCRGLFSDRSRPHGRTGQVELCRVESVRHSDGQLKHEFTFHLCQYVLDARTGVFKAGRVPAGRGLRDLLKGSGGLNSLQVQDRLAVVGPNEVRTRPPSFLTSLVEEFSKIFYVYQNLITWTWFNFAYWHMGIVYSMVYLLGGFSVAWVSYKNELSLSTLSRVTGRARVLRDGEWSEVDQRELVPGDVLHLEPGPAQCDLVLLSNPAVVDESSLTGESMPVVKAPLDEAALDLALQYEPNKHKKHTIFAGTTLLQVAQGEERSLALVTRTGAQTSKGELLRNILFSTSPRFQFDLEIELVIFILLCYAVFGFCVTLSFLREQPVVGWFYAMYVVGTCLPPLLPTVFVVAVGISSKRLLGKRVICSDPKRLLMAGKVRVAAFDKTGTLTKQGLDFLTVRTCDAGSFSQDEHLPLPSPRADGAPGLALSADTSCMARAMAVCHTLSIMRAPSKNLSLSMPDADPEQDQDTYVGNSVDVQMFKASGYELRMGQRGAPDRVMFQGSAGASWHNQVPVQLAILQRFDFEHKLMTQSSVVRDESKEGAEKGKVWVYAKGSAEAIKTRCDSSSLPPNFDTVAEDYSRQGLYVLAVARRELTEQEQRQLAQGDTKLDREKVEQGLSFLGFLLFKNGLKPDTAAALSEMRCGDVRTLIVSGDHVLTAIHVGKESELVPPGRTVLLGKLRELREEKASMEDSRTEDVFSVVWEDEAGNIVPLPTPAETAFAELELAVTGKVFRALEDSGELDALLSSIRIFGRMTPADKVSVVQHYVNNGWITLFCGDGGNDCGALRTAHVGVALSSAEASVVSPFTALDKSCQAVVQVLLEGRCALSAAFSSYKYMIMYGQVETINQMAAAFLFISFTEWCWVFMDGVWVVAMAFALPLATPPAQLADSRPTASLLGPYTLTSFLGILAINFAFLCISLGFLFDQDWFACRKWTIADKFAGLSVANAIGDNYETSVIFIISGWQYVASAMAFNFGGKHRSAWLANHRFVLLVVMFALMHVVITLVPGHLSCVFRVNCDNENVVPFIISMGKLPIQNRWNTTVMPVPFRWLLLLLIVVNTALVMLWERVVIYGGVGDWFRQSHPRKRFLKL